MGKLPAAVPLTPFPSQIHENAAIGQCSTGEVEEP